VNIAIDIPDDIGQMLAAQASGVAADAQTAITFTLSPGHAHDAPPGRELLKTLTSIPEGLPLLMDRAYEDNETRQLVLDLGMIPVSRPNRIGSNPGNTTALCTRNAMKSSASSGASKASAASSPASRNSTSCSSPSFTSLSSSMLSCSVNTP
jgi:hypothetical protein